jgi:hypothetical protein
MFGLRNAAQTCQRFVDKITRGLYFVYAYMDDFLIASEEKWQHHEHLRTLFERLNDYVIVINSAKSVFGVSEITFLKPLAERVEAIVNVPNPAKAKQLRRYLDMINFYRRFIQGTVNILQPLNDLLKGAKRAATRSSSEWSEQIENAFCESKCALANAAIGAVLQQHVNDTSLNLNNY